MLAAALAAAAALPVLGQQASTRVPTEKDPLRFSAFAMQITRGAARQVDIVIERWSTDAERQALIGLVMKSTDRPHGQDKLLKALEDIEPRTGFIRGANTIGYDLKYAHENRLPDGTRQIVVVTDKPVSFVAQVSQARTLDYPFSLIEMRFPPGGGQGEGKLLGQTSISVKDGRLELEIYGQEPTRLTTITEKKGKGTT